MREDWLELNLGEFLDFIGGGTPSKSNSNYWNGDIPWTSIKDLKGDELNQVGDYITQEGLNESSANVASIDEIILATRINPGKPIVAKIETAINQDLKVVKPKIEINTKYLFYGFKTIQKEVEKLSSGTTVLGINLNNLKSIKLNIAPLPEQRAIVAKIEALFSSLDQGIADLKKAQDQLKIYRQAVLKKAFEGELTKEWRIRNSYTTDSWGTLTFGEATDNFDGKRKPLSRSVRSNFQGIYPYYGACEHIDNVKEYLFDGTYMLIGEDGANLLSKMKPLSFIVEGKFWVNNHAHVVQPKEGVDICFLNLQFNSLQINEYVTGTAQPKLNQRNLNKIPVKIPPIEEQLEIVKQIDSRLTVCDKLEQSIEESLVKAEALRQSILKKAFEGKLLTEAEIKKCKQAPDYEPASVLLEKIRGEKLKS